jgi:DNA polymerase (family 10)
MRIENAEVAAVFNHIADLLELQDGNRFRIRAYRNAARTLVALAPSVQTMVAAHQDLTAMPGIGADLAGKIGEIVRTGSCRLLDELSAEVPAALPSLLRVPGLGPKRVRALHQQLAIGDLDQLRSAARAGRIRRLPGFGARTEQRILTALEARRSKKPRVGIAFAEPVATALLDYLAPAAHGGQIAVAGSFRRRQDTVADLDIVLGAHAGAEAVARFARFDGFVEVLAQGPTRASAVLRQGMQVDLRVVPPASFGAALQYFTGSKAHNIALRTWAAQRGLKVNEYGVFAGTRRLAGASEAELYAALGLAYIEPELRENRGEIEAARTGRLPALVTLSALRGDLHAHTDASDGNNTLRAMAQAARARGWSYLAITDHSARLGVAHGLTAERLARQLDEIERLNAEFDDFTVLKSCEVDINEDGTLDLPAPLLARLDLVVGAVHSGFGLTRERQTTRILRAMDHPCFTLLAHPSGRLLPEREPYDVDLARIVRHARARGCFLELNAQPSRLDLTDVFCQMAKEQGVLVSINSDAHSVPDFDDLRFGIGQARRGWLAAADVLNTRALAPLRALLAAARAGEPAPARAV